MKPSERIAVRLWRVLSPTEKANVLTTWTGTPGANKVLTSIDRMEESELREFFSSVKDGSLRVWLNEISTVLEKFLAKSASDEVDFDGDIRFLRRLVASTDKALFDKYLPKRTKYWETQPTRDVSYLRAHYELTQLQQLREESKTERPKSFLRETWQFQRAVHWLERLTIAITSYSHSSQLAKVIETEIRRDLYHLTSDEVFWSRFPIIDLFVKFYDWQTKENYPIEKLLDQLIRQLECLDADNKWNFFVLVLNHLMRSTWRTPTVLPYQQLSQLIARGLELNCFQLNGNLSLGVAITYVKSLCMLEDYQGAHEALYQSLDQIDANKKELAKIYLEGFIAYYEGKWEQNIQYAEQLSKFPLKPAMKFNYDFLVLQAYYQQVELDKAELLLRRIGDHLKKEKLASLHRQVFEKRLYFFKKFLKGNTFGSERQLAQELANSDLPYSHRLFFEKQLHR